MSGVHATVLAVLLSLVSAAGYALAAVAQSRLAASSPPTDGGRGALRALLARGRWWWAVGLNAAGALAHVAALHYGPLTLVQPLGALTLVAALPLGAYCARRRVTRAEWRGALWTLTGLVALISVTGPATPGDALTLREALLVAATTALLIATLTSNGRHGGLRDRARGRARGGARVHGGTTAVGGATTCDTTTRGATTRGARTAQGDARARGATTAPGATTATTAPTAPTAPGATTRRARGLRYATASGVASGVGSALTQTLTAALARQLPGGVPAWWQTALVAVLISAFAVGGLLLSQTAYRDGLAAPLAVVNLSNPAAAAVIGVALLGETFRAGVWGWLVAAAASVVAARGVVLLTTGPAMVAPAPQPPPPPPPRPPLPSPRPDEAAHATPAPVIAG